MKKIFFSIVVLVSFYMQSIAQGNLPGGFKHIIEVGRYSDYGKGYLTITDANGVGIIKNESTLESGIFEIRSDHYGHSG